MRVARHLFSVSFMAIVLLLSACGVVAQTKKAHVPTPTPVTTPSPGPTPSPTPIPAHALGIPIRLVIPSIGVDAPVERVGVVANGNLATPTQNAWDGVGWYNAGPRPGEAGSAVIDGHLDRPGGAPAVFWNLRTMQVGDPVQVITAQGKSVTFRTTHILFYQPQNAPLQNIFSNGTNGTYLNLITCAGYWVPSEHQTTLRLVVYTTLQV